MKAKGYLERMCLRRRSGALRFFLTAALLAGLALVALGAVGMMLLRLRSGQVLQVRRRR